MHIDLQSQRVVYLSSILQSPTESAACSSMFIVLPSLTPNHIVASMEHYPSLCQKRLLCESSWITQHKAYCTCLVLWSGSIKADKIDLAIAAPCRDWKWMSTATYAFKLFVEKFCTAVKCAEAVRLVSIRIASADHVSQILSTSLKLSASVLMPKEWRHLVRQYRV